MSIINKRVALRGHQVVPVVCNRCHHSVRLTRVNDRTRRALIEMGYYCELLRELDLLERTQRLFDRFPGSRHRVVAEHLHLDENERPTAVDEAFERALDEDAELLEFLKCGFLLPVRHKFVKNSVASYAAAVEVYRVPCPNCGTGSLCLEQEFFDQLG